MLRSEIRHLITTKLAAAEAVTSLVDAANIVESKVTPFVAAKLPGINVVTQRQTGSLKSLNIPAFDMDLRFDIEIYVQSMDEWIQKADAIAEAIENTLFTDYDFCRLGQFESYDVSYSLYEQGAQPIAVEVLSFSLKHYQEWQPVIPDTFETLSLNGDLDASET